MFGEDEAVEEASEGFGSCSFLTTGNEVAKFGEPIGDDEDRVVTGGRRSREFDNEVESDGGPRTRGSGEWFEETVGLAATTFGTEAGVAGGDVVEGEPTVLREVEAASEAFESFLVSTVSTSRVIVDFS